MTMMTKAANHAIDMMKGIIRNSTVRFGTSDDSAFEASSSGAPAQQGAPDFAEIVQVRTVLVFLIRTFDLYDRD